MHFRLNEQVDVAHCWGISCLERGYTRHPRPSNRFVAGSGGRLTGLNHRPCREAHRRRHDGGRWLMTARRLHPSVSRVHSGCLCVLFCGDLCNVSIMIIHSSVLQVKKTHQVAYWLASMKTMAKWAFSGTCWIGMTCGNGELSTLCEISSDNHSLEMKAFIDAGRDFHFNHGNVTSPICRWFAVRSCPFWRFM